jgi:hypothetical protein
MDTQHTHEERINNLTQQISESHARWINHNLIMLADDFEYKGKTPRERKREFERYVKKHVKMEQVASPRPKAPHDPDHECNYFEWVLYEKGKEVSRLKVELTHKEQSNEHTGN